MASEPRLPAELRPLFEAYLRTVDERLPGLLAGFYLEGSLALDAFNPRMSDVDFIAVASRPCSDEDVAGLATIHQALARGFPRWPLQGCYLQRGDLGQAEGRLAPHPHYHDGALDPASSHEPSAVTWAQLTLGGIALRGPEPDQLGIQVDWDALLAGMYDNLNSYWRSYVVSPQRMAWLLSDYGVQWVVLGVLRQLYTFRRRAIISKTGAGEYALAHLPARWHRIVGEALRIRAGEGRSAYRLRLTRALEAHAFLRAVLALCNRERRVEGMQH